MNKEGHEGAVERETLNLEHGWAAQQKANDAAPQFLITLQQGACLNGEHEIATESLHVCVHCRSVFVPR